MSASFWEHQPRKNDHIKQKRSFPEVGLMLYNTQAGTRRPGLRTSWLRMVFQTALADVTLPTAPFVGVSFLARGPPFGWV